MECTTWMSFSIQLKCIVNLSWNSIDMIRIKNVLVLDEKNLYFSLLSLNKNKRKKNHSMDRECNIWWNENLKTISIPMEMLLVHY